MKAIALIFALLLSPLATAQLQSFLVTWDPHTISSRDDFYKHLPAQASVLLELWKTRSVENVYLDPQQKDIKGEDIPMVTLVLKAKNEEQAHQLLSSMPFVKNDVIKYSLNPIGTFWLGQYDPSLFKSS